MTDTQRGVAAWLIVLVPVWVVLVLCTYWEPIAHDGWGFWGWHQKHELTVESLATYAHNSYVYNNPRIGNLLTLALYGPGPWHPIVTPLIELALFYVMTLLVLGRRPSIRRADDALVFATLIALAAVTVPSFGRMMFYRPYMGNYVFGLLVCLLLLVPYRLHLASPRRDRWWWTPALLVLGIAAGMSNEHTGPAFAALLAGAVWYFRRRDQRIAPWTIAGLVGLCAGGLALFLAPGHELRYDGIAQQASTVGRIFERGVVENVKIVALAVVFALPVLPWLVMGLVARHRAPQPASPATRIVERVLPAVAIAIAMTLLLSPIQGARLYLASSVLICIAVASFMFRQLTARWYRRALAGMAAAVLVYAGYRCTSAYARLAPEFADRLARLQAAPLHGGITIPVYSVERSHWSLGDDFVVDERLKNRVSAMFGLALVTLEPRR